MGLRTPSRFKTFGAQAQAGAEKQKQARENLMKPGEATKSALGGRASAGTQMVSATTGAQQAATKQMQEQGEQRAEKVDPTKMISGPTATSSVYTSGTPTTPTTPTAVSGTGGDVKATTQVVTTINQNIANIKEQIDQIDNDLKNASAADAKALNDKKTELENILKDYTKKLTEENLGEIADQSTFETEMEEREQVLAQKGNNVGKLAALFGRRGVGDAALASQVYGKDLENIQKAAAQGLISKEQAEQAAAEAKTQYIEEGKKLETGVEERAKSESEKIRALTIGYEGLKSEGYTDEQIKELFGDDFNKYFNEQDGKITDKVSATRKALEDAKKSQEDALKDAELEVIRAQEVETKDLKAPIESINNVLERIGGWGGWIGEQGTSKLAPIKKNIDRLIADFENEKKYFKTPEDRENALNELKGKINNEKTNAANELAAFLGDTNTNFWDAAKAAQELIDSKLIDSLSPENKQMIINRMARELDKRSVRNNQNASTWGYDILTILGGLDKAPPVVKIQQPIKISGVP